MQILRAVLHVVGHLGGIDVLILLADGDFSLALFAAHPHGHIQIGDDVAVGQLRFDVFFQSRLHLVGALGRIAGHSQPLERGVNLFGRRVGVEHIGGTAGQHGMSAVGAGGNGELAQIGRGDAVGAAHIAEHVGRGNHHAQLIDAHPLHTLGTAGDQRIGQHVVLPAQILQILHGRNRALGVDRGGVGAVLGHDLQIGRAEAPSQIGEHPAAHVVLGIELEAGHAAGFLDFHGKLSQLFPGRGDLGGAVLVDQAGLLKQRHVIGDAVGVIGGRQAVVAAVLLDQLERVGREELVVAVLCHGVGDVAGIAVVDQLLALGEVYAVERRQLSARSQRQIGLQIERIAVLNDGDVGIKLVHLLQISGVSGIGHGISGFLRPAADADGHLGVVRRSREGNDAQRHKHGDRQGQETFLHCVSNSSLFMPSVFR